MDENSLIYQWKSNNVTFLNSNAHKKWMLLSVIFFLFNIKQFIRNLQIKFEMWAMKEFCKFQTEK